MNASLTFRPIQSDDDAFLYRVYASTREEELALVDWDGAQKTSFLRMQFTAQHRYYQAQFPTAVYLVILRDGAPVGRLYIDRRDDEICVLDIALLREYRRAGIGGAILRDLLAEADGAGKPVRIHVEHFNPALRLYERLGFTRVGDTGVYYHMERVPVGVGRTP
jgi:ribosomal protein S18 acetylase RimI-like enzyme